MSLSSRGGISDVRRWEGFRNVNKLGKDTESCLLCLTRATHTTSEVAVIAYLVTMAQTKRNLEKVFWKFRKFCVLFYVGPEKKNWRLGDKSPHDKGCLSGLVKMIKRIQRSAFHHQGIRERQRWMVLLK